LYPENLYRIWFISSEDELRDDEDDELVLDEELDDVIATVLELNELLEERELCDELELELLFEDEELEEKLLLELTEEKLEELLDGLLEDELLEDELLEL
jgi:hypothetical protein